MLRIGAFFGLLFCMTSCQSPQAMLSDRVCLLTTSTEQLSAEGVALSVASQQISYNAQGLPVQYNYQFAGRDSSFRIEYKGTTAVRALSTRNGSGELIFQYNASSQLARVTYLLGGTERAACTLEYEGGHLSRLREVWKPGTPGLPFQQRTFSFQTNAEENIQVQRVSLTAADGSTTEEEWQFSFDKAARRGPYADVGQTTLLTVMALTSPADRLPCRFLQPTCLAGYQRFLLRNGQRILVESASFEPEFDQLPHPVRVSADLTLSASGATPASLRRLVQTFQYSCFE